MTYWTPKLPQNIKDECQFLRRRAKATGGRIGVVLTLTWPTTEPWLGNVVRSGMLPSEPPLTSTNDLWHWRVMSGLDLDASVLDGRSLAIYYLDNLSLLVHQTI